MKGVIVRLISLAAIFIPLNGYAQVWKELKDSVNISGGVNLTSSLYHSFNKDSLMNNSREPFFWQINANLMIQYKKIAIPFSVSLTKERQNFTHPFHMPSKRIGFSPTYEGVTLHVGYRSLSFSEFTLSGNMFLGAGVEVKRKELPIEISVLFGRFSEAFEGESNQFVSPELALFTRYGWGSKLTYTHEVNQYSLICFKAWDKPHSLSEGIKAALHAKPAENLVLGLNFRHQFGKPWQLEGEYAFSALTRDIEQPDATLDQFSYLNNLGRLFTPRVSSSYNSAYWFKLNYAFRNYQVHLKYRKISPEYRTLGAVFLANDLQDVSAGIVMNLLKNTLNVRLNGGWQQSSLDLPADQRNKRFIGSMNLSTMLGKKLPLSLSFSNFNAKNFQTRFTKEDPSAIQDSIYYLQVTHQAVFSLGYSSGNKLKQNTSLNLTYQDTYNGQQGNQAGMRHYAVNISQQWNLPLSMNFSAQLSLNHQEGELAQSSWMPVFRFGRNFLRNRLRHNVSFLIQNTYKVRKRQQEMYKLAINSSLRLFDNQNISFNLAWLNKSSIRTSSPPLSELQGQFAYQYTF